MLTPLFDKVVVRPDRSLMRHSIYIPDAHRAPSSCMVVSVGNKVNPLIKPNMMVIINNTSTKRTDSLNQFGDFMIPESDIHGIIHNKKVYPIGRWVLVKRLMNNQYKGLIAIPDTMNYQTLEAEVVRFGITQAEIKTPYRYNDINPGDRVRLTRWEAHMIELGIDDDYCLLVKETDLLYRYVREEEN